MIKKRGLANKTIRKGRRIKKKEARVKREKKRPFPRGSPVVKAPGTRKGEGRLDYPGAFVVNFLAKENHHIAKVRDAIYSLPRDEIAARLALIYCEILGLAGMERQ